MEAVFLKLLNLSLTAGWLVLAVLLLRLIFRKAPRWIFCLLWGLVALRLACPISLESALSLIPSAEPIPSSIAYETVPTINSGFPALDQAVNPALSQRFAPAAEASVNPLQVAVWAASRVWLVGLAAMLVYALVSYLLLKRRVRTATLLRDNIRQSERADFPFVLGFFRPRIYLPYAISGGEIDHILAHEQAHIKRHDHWWKLIGFLILAVYWFNPLVWLAYVLFCRDIELACDEKVIAGMEKDARRAYSTALLNCSIRQRSLAACPLAFGEVGVKDRVKNVMNYKKPAFWIVIVALLACIAAAVCFLTVPESGAPWILAEDGSGLPAPQGGPDPYTDLEPAQRAAAFLQNADMISYEFTPILMYGTYIVPVMEYTPHTVAPANGSDPLTLDSKDRILGYLHHFDLSSLEPMELSEIKTFEINTSISGLIHVGDARCRTTVWYSRKPIESQDFNTALVFTFSDGTMCGFDGGTLGEDVVDIHRALNSHTFSESDGYVTVTRLSTGESRRSSNYFSALLACIFDNTVLLAPKADNQNGQFDWQVSIEGGAIYLFDSEKLLIQTEGGQVYPIGGFEESSDDVLTPEVQIRTMVLHGFDVPQA